ncbi:hypothetical protein EMCRGX_G030892 [Ephydatia muelleri]
MSFRGRGRGGFRGGRGGRGGGRGGFTQDFGPPQSVVELGSFVHPCEGDLVCKGTIEKVPYFNAPIYLENKSQVGKVDEIFGAMNNYYFSVKLSSDMQASSFATDQKLYIDPMKLLPLMRFLPAPKIPGAREKGGARRGRGTPRGGRGGGFRGGSGGFRGGSGGFRGRGGSRGGGRF